MNRINTLFTICLIKSVLILVPLFTCGTVAPQELLSECDFVRRTAHNCQWNNSVGSSPEWTVSDLGLITHSSNIGKNVLFLKSDSNRGLISGSFESQFFSCAQISRDICLKTHYIVSQKSSDIRLAIKVIDRIGRTIERKECSTRIRRIGSNQIWNSCQIAVNHKKITNDTEDIKFTIRATLDPKNDTFVALSDISVIKGACLLLESTYHFSSNASSESTPGNDRIGPRVTLWVILMVGFTILSCVVFIYIAVYNMKKETKKRQQRSTAANNNNSIEASNEGLSEEEIFSDEYQILPRGGSFLIQIFRQFGSNLKEEKNNN